MMVPHELTIQAARRHMRDGELTARELMESPALREFMRSRGLFVPGSKYMKRRRLKRPDAVMMRFTPRDGKAICTVFL